MRGGRLFLAALVVLGLGPWVAAPVREGERAPAGLAERLLGPVTSLVASATWVRFDLALRDGEPARAYALAERALELEPGAWQGWANLGLHLVFDRGSAELGEEPEERRRWVRAGLEVLARGASRARHGAELELLRGLVLGAWAAPQAGSLGWPGGAEGALEESCAAFEAALAGGHPRAGERLAEARTLLAEVRAGAWPEGWPERP